MRMISILGQIAVLLIELAIIAGFVYLAAIGKMGVKFCVISIIISTFINAIGLTIITLLGCMED